MLLTLLELRSHFWIFQSRLFADHTAPSSWFCAKKIWARQNELKLTEVCSISLIIVAPEWKGMTPSVRRAAVSRPFLWSL